MAAIKFPGFKNQSLILRSFETRLGTGCSKQRFGVLVALDDEYCDGPNVLFSMAGCLDAPDSMPNGATVAMPKYNHWGEQLVCNTRPGEIIR